MQKSEERFNLLKEACEVAVLDGNTEILKGKKIVFSEKNGLKWNPKIFSEFDDISEDSVRICITPICEDMFRVLMSMNIEKWGIDAEYIMENIKANCNDSIFVDYKKMDVYDGILAFTVTFL